MSGNTGYLTSSGTDLSSVLMNINGYGQMNQYNGSGTNDLSSNTLINCASCSLTPGTYIISLSTYNTSTNSPTGTINPIKIGISTATNAINTNGFDMSSTSSVYPATLGTRYLFANCTQVLNVSASNTFYLIQNITFTGNIIMTVDKSKCFIRVTRLL
jgi:hypothetical protein